MKRKKHRFLAFSWLLCALLIMSPFLSYTSFAQPDPKTSVSLLENSDLATKNVKAKVNSKLYDQFSKNKNVTFLLKLKDQVDTHKVATDTAKTAKVQKQTSAKTKWMKRSAVVSSLRAKANETQHTIKAYLNEEKRNGNVKEFQSFYIVNAVAVTGTKEVMDKLASFPEVEKILPNETRQLITPTNKTSTHNKSNNTSSPQTAGTASIEWNIERVGAPQVWNMGIDGAGTVVASIDTGVQWNHPALKEKYHGYNPAQPDQPDHIYNWFDAVNGQASPYDDNGHGTHTMGTMVGSEPNGTNQIGVAPGAKWIAVKAFTAEGSGSDVDLLEAGEWILAPKDAQGNPHPEKAPDVVNNSWGGGPGLDEWYRSIVQNWRAADIFPEFSAGNSGPDSGSIDAPSNYPESFATGATDIHNQIASFSSRGPSPYGEIKPEVSAPGVNIRSSVPGSGYEGGWNGTSMAGPHVSAVVALMKQANAALTVDEIEQILLDTAIPITDSAYPDSPNNGYGHGLVNAIDAVSAVADGLGRIQGQVVREGQDTEHPTYQHTPPTETYTGLTLPLTIQVQDNVSVSSVELQYRTSENTEWQIIEATRTAGDYKNGTYQAIVPADAVQIPTFTYHWRITDYGQNAVTSDDYVIPVQTGIGPGYYQDFESQPIGWISYGTKNTWEWGIPASGPGNAASGEKVYATNLKGNYDNTANMSLMMPPIDLPEGNTYLQFKDWYELENSWDYGHVFVSTDQQNWQQLSRFSGNSLSWVQRQIDLSAYAGQRIYIAFNVTTDFSVVKPGWYIDDVALSNTPLTTASTAQEEVQKEKVFGTKPDSQQKTDKKPVNPDTIKPTKVQNVMAPTATVTPKAIQPMSLPLGATVSVLESGRSVNTNPADGSYSMTHAAGEYTLRAESYGYRSVDQQVNIPVDGTAEAHFTLDPIPQGTVNGTVTNKQTGQPIASATLLLMEDALIQPVQTDENGHFSITAYEGTYTLHVSAPLYHGQDITITIPANGNTEQNVQLRPFIGYPGEIGYDDGTPENARAWDEAGNAWAVKMSLPEGKSALVTAGLFRFWDTEWPVPGETSFKVAVYDASGPDGAPGRKLLGPVDATALRNGEWTVVDLASGGVVVNGDFYMVYIQAAPYPHTPGLATDESSQNAGRSWQMLSGSWSPSPQSHGNFMIRARVNYEAISPVITSPKDGAHTHQSTVTVEGKASPTTQVRIFNNGEELAATPARDDGTFSVDVTLQNGENILTATSSTDRGSTDPSEPVKIILDQAKPELTINKPADGLKTNQQAVTVEGKATDDYLASVTVNGQEATVAEDGFYSLRILLHHGENILTVTAMDRAGNETSHVLTVNAKFQAPSIENLKPDRDVVLKKRDTLKIELDSEPGIRGSFVILLPLSNSTQSITELPLTEKRSGHYVATWTAPKGKIKGAQIEVIMRDDYGNVSRQAAAGKLYVNVKPK